MDALLDLLWKSSLLLAGAGVAALLARRASAATRHLIWTAGLTAALALPLGSALLPRLPVAALPATPVRALLPTSPAPPGRALPLHPPGSVELAGSRTAPLLPSPRPPEIDWARVARLVWASIALALLLRVAAGDLQLQGIARRAQRAVDREWLDLLEECSARIGFRRPVILLHSGEVEVPITWGTLQPRIVVPSAAAEWRREHRRAVLLHELAHVGRRDALTQLIARVCCALHWVNPLAWLGARAMRLERERACDDRVLREGARPTEYASSLLEVARNAAPGSGGTALAMARRAQLEGRLLAVLDPRADRRPAGRRRTVAVACAAACIAAPLAAVQAERAGRAPADPAPMSPPALADLSQPASRPAPKPRIAQATPPTPPAPPTPPTPPAPPAPPSGRGTHIESHDGSSVWTSSWSDGSRSSTAVARGEIRWSADADDIASISPGGSFDLTIQEGARHWHAEIFPGAEGLARTLLVDGSPRPWDRQWFARALEDLDRHTGFAAEIRFPKLYRQGGARAVLAWVDGLEGDHVRRRYLTLLVARDPMDDSTAQAVFRAVEKMSGDYERAEVLRAAAAKARLDTDAKREAFLKACLGVHGDYERGRVLHELIAQPKLSPGLTGAVLEAVSTMSGDYEKAQALTGLAQRHPADAIDYLRSATKVAGDYEHARVLKALIGAQKLDGAAQVEVIRQARRLGDYESTEVLVALTGSTRLTAEAQREYQSAAQRLGDYSRKRALAALER